MILVEIESTIIEGNSLKVNIAFNEDASLSQVEGLIRVSDVNGLIGQKEITSDENEYEFTVPAGYSNPLLFITLTVENQESQTVKIIR